MQIKDFEAQLQQTIDKDLTIRTNPNAPDIAGIYWKEAYTGVSVPPEEIREVFDKGYTDKMGYPYRNMQMTLDLLKGKLPRTQDPENYKLLTTK